MINATTKAKLVLFSRQAKPDDKPGVVYPAVYGSIENNDFKVNVSGFLKQSGNGKRFLSLVIRNENDEQTFSGTLHRSEKAGKEDTYYGYISEQFEDEVDGQTQYSNSDWQLGIAAEIRVARETQRRYYAGDVYPLKKTRSGTSEQPAAAPAEELPL